MDDKFRKIQHLLKMKILIERGTNGYRNMILHIHTHTHARARSQAQKQYLI